MFLKIIFAVCALMATPKGLEPSTSCVTGRRSTLLSYGAICVTYLCTDGVTNHPLMVLFRSRPKLIETQATYLV